MLKMQDLKMMDKYYGVWKMTDHLSYVAYASVTDDDDRRQHLLL